MPTHQDQDAGDPDAAAADSPPAADDLDSDDAAASERERAAAATKIQAISRGRASKYNARKNMERHRQREEEERAALAARHAEQVCMSGGRHNYRLSYVAKFTVHVLHFGTKPRRSSSTCARGWAPSRYSRPTAASKAGSACGSGARVGDLSLIHI